MSTQERVELGPFSAPGRERAAPEVEPRKGGTVLFNLSLVGAAEIVSRIAQIVSVSVMSRALGPEAFGVVGTAWALFFMALPMAQIAPELIGVRAIASSPGRLPVIGEITLLKLLASAAALALWAAYALLFHAGDSVTQQQVIVQSLVLFGVALSFGWVFRGLQQWRFHALLRSSQAVSMTILLYCLLRPFPHPLTVPLIELSTFLASAGVGVVLLKRWLRKHGQRDAVDDSHWFASSTRGTLRRHGHSFRIQGVSALCAAVNVSVCIPVAALFLAPEQIGLLTIAIRLTLALSAIFLLAIQLFFPILAVEVSSQPERARETAAALVCYASTATGLGYLLLALLAEPVLLLLFGPAFRDAALCLRVLGLCLIPIGVGAVYMYLLLAHGRERDVLVTTLSASLLIVVGNPLVFALWPVPHAVFVIPVALFAQTLAMGLYCHLGGLIGGRAFDPRRLSPERVRTFLRSHSAKELRSEQLVS